MKTKKMMLIIDKPKGCADCELNYSDYYCQVAGYGILGHRAPQCPMVNGFPGFCPLKPLPEKKEIDIEPHLEFVPETYESGYTHGYERGKEIGWNDCIDVILGETE